jgi:hypothetical protein
VNLAREVLPVEVVLTGSVEVKLGKVVGLAADRRRAANSDLDVVSQVLELGTRGVRVDSEGEGGAADGILLSVDVDRGLVGTSGAELKGTIKAVPVQRTFDLMVAPNAFVPLGKVRGTGVQGGAVVARSSSQRGERGESNNRLHFDCVI